MFFTNNLSGKYWVIIDPKLFGPHWDPDCRVQTTVDMKSMCNGLWRSHAGSAG
jgi:hypothetical protein